MAAPPMSVRPIERRDIPALRALLSQTLPISTHIATGLEAMEWNPDQIARRCVGVFTDTDIHALVLTGQVVRAVLFTTVDDHDLDSCLRAAVTPDTRALMGPENIIASVREAFPLSSERHFVVWEGSAEARRVERIRLPAPHELASFAEASFRAFHEEVGAPPAASPDEQTYLNLWEEARQRGRLIGMWDDNGRCVFRVEIRPALGLIAELRGLWLDPALRGAGIGQALLDETAAYVANAVAPRIQVIMDFDNAVASRLYRRAGFVPVGRLARLELPMVGG